MDRHVRDRWGAVGIGMAGVARLDLVWMGAEMQAFIFKH